MLRNVIIMNYTNPVMVATHYNNIFNAVPKISAPMSRNTLLYFIYYISLLAHNSWSYRKGTTTFTDFLLRDIRSFRA